MNYLLISWNYLKKICNSNIEILSSTSTPNISEETRDTLVTIKFHMCNATLQENTRPAKKGQFFWIKKVISNSAALITITEKLKIQMYINTSIDSNRLK